MKPITLIPLLALTLSIPASAQNTPAAPTTPAEPLATIDPKALQLLARVADKYEHIRHYAGLSTVNFGTPAKPQSARFRLSLAFDGTGLITRADERGTERWMSNGRFTRATTTRRPKQYLEEPLNASHFWRIAREEFFMRAGFEGILPKFLTGDLGGLILEPDLRSVSMESTAENGATQKVTVTISITDKPDYGSVTFFIDDDLVLRRATLVETVNNEEVWDEVYTETVIAKEIPEGYYKSFDATVPKGYKRVDTFDPGPEATPPVDNTPPAKLSKPSKPSKPKASR